MHQNELKYDTSLQSSDRTLKKKPFKNFKMTQKKWLLKNPAVLHNFSLNNLFLL